MNPNTRVVITGMGAVTPLGNSVSSYWTNLLAGKSGAVPISKFDASLFKTQFACELQGFEIDNYLDKKEARKLDPFVHYAIAATDEAIAQAGLSSTEINYNKVGVIWASGNGGITTFEEQMIEFAQGNGTPRFNPFFIPRILVDIAAGHISMRHGFRGVNYCPVSACASSNTAIIDAMNYIKLGYANVIIAGGSEAPITRAAIGGFGAMKALSTNNENYASASRPFDATRDGFVMGEGAGALVLENYDHAIARGATILAEVCGGGMSADAYHLTSTHPEGLGARLAMEQACELAHINTTDINYINMHATSTPVGDLSELNAVTTFMGDAVTDINIGATKSMTGHLLGASGAIEAIACVLAVAHNVVPPTINVTELDETINPALNFTLHSAHHRIINYAMSNNFGFGGHNASVVFGKV
jgi:3-oxoacyl-[acyl-carrier-protein] synthase II